MKIVVIKVAKTLIPLSIGLFFIWYSLVYTSTEEQNQELWNSIVNAKKGWVFLSAFLGILSHVSRAYRWTLLVKPLGYKPRFSVSYMALMMGYLINLGIPRSGEVFRAASLSNYEKIPFQKTIGTIISERIIDLVMLLFCVLIAFIFNQELFVNYIKSNNISPVNMIFMLVAGILILGGSYYFIKKSNIKFLQKIKKFILEIYEGVLSIFKMEKRIPFILHTLFIWGNYVLMFYIMIFAIPEISNLGIAAIIMAFVAGSFAMTATNGGIGTFPYALSVVLLLFSIEESQGKAYGWILWIAQTASNVLIGGLSFILLPFFSKRK